MMIHNGRLFSENHMTREFRRYTFLKKSFLFVVLSLVTAILDGSCPPTTPWSTPVNLSNSGGITSNIFSAATSAGFMAVWADSSNNAHYSFST